MLTALLSAAFPDLESDGGVVIAAPDDTFNCVAWAAGKTDQVWWPDYPDAYWPPAVPDELTITAFVGALATVGYTPCDDGEHESGYEKAAIYLQNGLPTHVARQSTDGRWSSKLGRDCLVSHATPQGVEGAIYGKVGQYVRRTVG